jgi:hypothetical protein
MGVRSSAHIRARSWARSPIYTGEGTPIHVVASSVFADHMTTARTKTAPPIFQIAPLTMQPKVPQDIIEEIVWCIDRESSDFSATLRVWRSVSLGFRRAADAVLFHDVHLDTTKRQQDDWTPRKDRLLRMAGKNRHIPRLVRRLQITIPVSGERVMDRDIREVRSFLGVIELRITVRGWGSRTWSELPTYKTKFCKGLLAATDLQRLELEELEIPMNVLLACSRLKRLRLTRASVTEVVESSMKIEPWSCLEVLDLFGSPVTVELLTALAVGSGVRELTYHGASSADPGDCNRLIDVLKGSLTVLKIASLNNGEILVSCGFGPFTDCLTFSSVDTGYQRGRSPRTSDPPVSRYTSLGKHPSCSFRYPSP